MLEYEIYCKILDHLGRQQLTVAQTARALGLDPRTVAKWASVKQFRPRVGRARSGKLDPHKGQIVRWLDAHAYSAQQIFQRLCEAGYEGGITIVKDYVHCIRPRRAVDEDRIVAGRRKSLGQCGQCRARCCRRFEGKCVRCRRSVGVGRRGWIGNAHCRSRAVDERAEARHIGRRCRQ